MTYERDDAGIQGLKTQVIYMFQVIQKQDGRGIIVNSPAQDHRDQWS